MNCHGCGEPLTGRQRQWCSDRCRDAVRRPSLYDAPIRTPRDAVYANPGNRGTQRSGEGTCEFCGSDLPAASRRSRKFCSEACKKQAKRRRADSRVGSPRSRERRLEYLSAKNERDLQRALRGGLRVAGLEPGSDPELGERLSRRRGSDEAIQAAQVFEAGLRPAPLTPRRADTRPLWRQILDTLKHGVEIGGRLLRIRDGQDVAAVLEVVDEPSRQRALDYVAWRRGVYEIGVLENELGPEHRPALPLRIVPVYSADGGRTPTPPRKEPEVTNQEILERVEKIEDTLAIMLRDAAEAAQRLAARHPERPDLLKTVDALLDDIVAKGR
jgi:hypothetical protein